MKKRLGRWLGIQLIAAAACVASCGSPAEYMPRDGGAADGGAGRGGGGGKVAATGGHSGNAGGTAGRAGTGGPAAPGVGGSPVGAGGASPAGTGGGGDGGVSTGGSVGGTGGRGGTGGGGVVGTGGSVNVGGRGGSGVVGTGGSVNIGGRGGSGVAAGRGGSGVAGSPGTGGTPGCSGTMKVCNGGCIAASECCGGCSGNTPVCSNGSCVGRPLGDTCTAGSVCTSGMCADGVCCDATCTGQCESCATTSNRGRCVATTTPRTACAGSGTCGSVCNGTNRTACVFPANTTSCGAAAACTNGTATTAALCNGAGTCSSASSMSCMFGCRTDGTPTCATSCPTNQGLCSGTCVDIQSSSAHCGASCLSCQGRTPKCSSGSCVECLAPSDCPAPGSGCATNHTCLCRPKSAANVIPDSNFNDPALPNWHPERSDAWVTEDADGCMGSGSVIPQVSRCVSVKPNTRYYFGYRYKIWDNFGMAQCSVFLTSSTDCSGDSLGRFDLVSTGSGPTGWMSAQSVAVDTPTGTNTADIFCTFPSGGIWTDQFYLSTTDGY